MAKRSNQPRELVRLSPLQFSLSVSIVVILLGAAALAGYYHGLKQHIPPNGSTAISSTDELRGKESKPDAADSQTSVTFYSALKEPRKEVPAVSPPPMKSSKARVKPVPAAPAASVPLQNDPPVPRKGSVTLQVASYKDQSSARKLLQDLSSEGYAGTVVRVDLGERGVWFRVRIGPYAGEQSESILKKLRDERKLKGYVVK